ncbi:MAG: hypothetical protein IPK72_16195 [Candidatus Eisenbacteria bacterium]|nr:hypothetical protein [Candidatus Eisenbacteria bacterium]
MTGKNTIHGGPRSIEIEIAYGALGGQEVVGKRPIPLCGLLVRDLTGDAQGRDGSILNALLETPDQPALRAFGNLEAPGLAIHLQVS